MATAVLVIDELEDCVVTKLVQPVLSGGPATCNFTSYNDYAVGTTITVKDGSLTRFEGTIVKKTNNQTAGHSTQYSYVAFCQAYCLACATDYTISDIGALEEVFSGNGVEYAEWVLKEIPGQHVVWPLTGSASVTVDESDIADALPENLESIGYTQENSLPSHIKCVVRKYREARFPVIADFDYSFIPTSSQLKTDGTFAGYGKQFKVMTSEDPTVPYTASAIAAAAIGGSKLFIKGHPDAKYLKKDNLSVSVGVSGKKTTEVLSKVGASLPVPVATAVKSGIVYASMVYDKDMSLPRVTGAWGTDADQQECLVRVRILESITAKSVSLGGVNTQDRLPSVNHIEVDVAYDTYDGTHYRDWTFGGAPGLLHEDHDLGGGVWTHDLTGTYIAEEGDDRATRLVNAALTHYENMRYTNNVVVMGLNWTLFSKILIGSNNILIDSIEYEVTPGSQRTKIYGVRTLKGFSQQLAKKKRWIEQQENIKDKQRLSTAHVEVHEPELAKKQTKLHAIIAWNFRSTTEGDCLGDMSIGELVEFTDDTLVWTRKGEFIWIDFIESRCPYDTAGDDTIFVVELIESDVTRDGVEYDLYRAVSVQSAGGKKITHLEVLYKESQRGYLLSFDDLSQVVWTDIETYGNNSAAYLTTTINSVVYKNLIYFDIPNNWNLAGSGTFKYLEITGIAGQRKTFVPISPRLISGNDWESAETFLDTTTTISTYTSKII